MRFDTIRPFLCGVTLLSTLEHLKTNIRQVNAEIPPNMCQKEFENYFKRISACNTSREDHLNDFTHGFTHNVTRSNVTVQKEIS